MFANNLASYIQTLVIFLTGLFAFIIYWFTKRNEKRSAAQIIYLEVKKAEETIYQIKSTGFATDETLIMINQSWDKYRHLFIKRLNQEEFSFIEDFYATCKQSQAILNETKMYHDTAFIERAAGIQRSLGLFAEKDSLEATSFYEVRKANLLNRMHQEDYWYIPNLAKEKLNKYLQSYKPIIGTTTFEKIRKMARI